MTSPKLHVSIPAGGFAREAARDALTGAGLSAVFAQLAPGPFGTLSAATAALEATLEAVDLGAAANAALGGLILEQAAAPGSFALPRLTPEQHRLVGAFQLIVTIDAAHEALDALAGAPPVEGALELDGLEGLLESAREPSHLATRVAGMAANFVRLRARPRGEADTPEDRARECTRSLAAFLELLRRAILQAGESGALGALVRTLKRYEIRVADRRYEGLVRRAETRDVSGLLPIRPEHIVGNEAFLQAGLRLARDVAGYDLRLKKNPKRINPVLFGLGRPGSGKTVTAHAIGNYFLEFCAQRQVPATFVVVRRTDWASSYQNASAANLVELFTDRVYGFDGVAGVYWPDIDTAFASRGASDLRMEEKQNLGAVFGVFDGTLLPKDGKWFLICDANTMHMDEATVSRIAQNPFRVDGPSTPAHYATLMRDLMLEDVRDFVPASDDAWQRLGTLCADHDLSGRQVDAICGNVRATIQDFEYPDAYFSADADQRAAILQSLCTAVDEARIVGFIDDFVRFHKDAEERATEERFNREVEQMVRQLNAGRAAAKRAALELPPDGDTPQAR